MAIGEPGAWERHFRRRNDQLIDLVKELVTFDSPSTDRARLGAVVEWTANRLAALGADVKRVSGGDYGDHLIARIKGRENDLPPLLILGHLDTVWPSGEASKRPPRLDDGRLTGPGVYDMKAGIAMALFALGELKALGQSPRRPVTVIFNTDEELGSLGSRSLIEAEARRSAAALVMEPSTSPDLIRLRRKGTGMFRVTVHGRAAHAGAEPEAGASAVLELAHQTIHLHNLTDEGTGVTVNVGTFHGGSRRNVVPERAEAVVDLRMVLREEGERAAELIRGLSPVLTGTTIDVSGGINRPPMEGTLASGGLFAAAADIASDLGYLLREELAGGASDANFTSAAGCATLCGLGGVGGGAHALTEHVLVEWLPRKTALFTTLLLRV